MSELKNRNKESSRVAVILPTYSLKDPVTRNTINSVLNLFDKIIIVEQYPATEYSFDSKKVEIKYLKDFRNWPRKAGLKSTLKWLTYKFYVNKIVRKYKPDLIISFMLSPLAALNFPVSSLLVSCIYDIPSEKYSGRLDSIINKKGFKKLATADIVWSSDPFKADLTKEMAQLNKLPYICYNCPDVNYAANIDKHAKRRWLRERLIQQGAPISHHTGSVLIRAGAIGIYGGIENTILAMKHLPDDHIFLMMGRPEISFELKVKQIILDEGLQNRVFLWKGPDDETWKNALFGADIGHLIHEKPYKGSPEADIFRLNSSLSNNRIFYYMAAALPILSYEDDRLTDLHRSVDCFQVVSPDDINDIKNKWISLSENNNLYDEQSLNSFKAYKTEFSWQIQFSKVRSQITARLSYDTL